MVTSRDEDAGMNDDPCGRKRQKTQSKKKKKKKKKKKEKTAATSNGRQPPSPAWLRSKKGKKELDTADAGNYHD